jgi:hypothetical protein
MGAALTHNDKRADEEPKIQSEELTLQLYIEFGVDTFFHFDASVGAGRRGAHSRHLYR